MNRIEQPSFLDMRARGNWVRLRTLLVLRWIAVAGQTAAVLIATQWFGFELPLALSALCISASASFNVIAHMTHPAETRLSERGTLASLFFDLAQLVSMLMLTGGLNNPFAMLILAPVTVAATALRLRSALWLGVLALLAISLMSFVHVPLVTAGGDVLEVPNVYRYGIVAALAIGLVFLGLYARRVSVESHAMSEALAATQLALAREQRLAAIGGMAAAAAHELGTPLATIKLVAGELARELAGNAELADDVQLIRREVERCGAIMTDLAQGGRDDAHVKLAPVSAVIAEAARPHADRGKSLVVRIDGVPAERADGTQPTVARSPELIHGLRNLIQNAVDFAASTVWVDADLAEDTLRIAVGDDGPGFGPDILPRLGEPYVSSRGRGDPRGGRRVSDRQYEGMGLGLFIARTLLERTGARVAFANGSDPRKRRPAGVPVEHLHPPGAIIEMVWPVAALVAPPGETRRALGPNRRFDG